MRVRPWASRAAPTAPLPLPTGALRHRVRRRLPKAAAGRRPRALRSIQLHPPATAVRHARRLLRGRCDKQQQRAAQRQRLRRALLGRGRRGSLGPAAGVQRRQRAHRPHRDRRERCAESVADTGHPNVALGNPPHRPQAAHGRAWARVGGLHVLRDLRRATRGHAAHRQRMHLRGAALAWRRCSVWRVVRARGVRSGGNVCISSHAYYYCIYYCG